MPYDNISIIVVLYEHTGFGGQRLVLTENTPDLGVYGFHDKTSSIKIHAGPNYVAGTEHKVSFYSDSNYGGAQLVLVGPGEYYSLGQPYNFHDVISSVKFNQGVAIPNRITSIPVVAELYEHHNFSGRKLIVVENIPDLQAYGRFGDTVSSVKVYRGPNYTSNRKVRLYRDSHGRGGYIELGINPDGSPGEYRDINASHSFGDTCSSVYVNY